MEGFRARNLTDKVIASMNQQVGNLQLTPTLFYLRHCCHKLCNHPATAWLFRSTNGDEDFTKVYLVFNPSFQKRESFKMACTLVFILKLLA